MLKHWSLAFVVAASMQAGFGAGAYRQQDAGVVMPTLVKCVDPEYSSWAFRQRIEGTTALEAVVSSDGAIADVHVTQSIDPSGGLDKEAIRAVRQWRFLPGRYNGRPSAIMMQIELAFRLPAKAPVPGEPPSAESESAFKRGAFDASTPGFVAPKVTYEFHPSYTEDATREKIQGDVGVQVYVQADGSIGKVRVARSVDPRYGLDQQAVNAVRTWKFEAATLNGKPVPAVVSVVISFRLH
jgi:TonB family protein